MVFVAGGGYSYIYISVIVAQFVLQQKKVAKK